MDARLAGTINIANLELLGLDLHAKVSKFMSQNSSSSTVLVQYRLEGRFEEEILQEPIRFKHGCTDLPKEKFREKYGDYWIAGQQKGYSCTVIAVCK